MSDETLVKLVKQYSVLYDASSTQYRDHAARNSAWEEIAEQMNESAEEVKNKWSKLRNCFTNALKRRRKKSGQAATIIVPWKLEKQMRFLLPHIEGRSADTNLGDTNDDDDSPIDSKLLVFEESKSFLPPTINSPIPRTSKASESRAVTPNLRANKDDSDNDLLKKLVNAMKASQEVRQKRAVPDLDEDDLFFLSMSKQVKKLPKTDQAEIKFQLHKLIHESEMKMLNNCERILNTPTNSTGK